MNNDDTFVNSLTVDHLKIELRSRNISTEGNKTILRSRLLNAFEKDKGSKEMEKDGLCDSSKERIEFTKIVDFDNFSQDFIEFKKYTYDNFTRINAALEEESKITNTLEDENAFLKQEIKNKQIIIDILVEDIKSMKGENIQQKTSW